MTGEVENLVLEHLRALRADISDIRLTQNEHSVRFTKLSAAVAGLRRDQALDAEAGAHLAARIDRLRDDVDRIKRRLELTD